jgi:multidrug efflux system membrane fusion protein
VRIALAVSLLLALGVAGAITWGALSRAAMPLDLAAIRTAVLTTVAPPPPVRAPTPPVPVTIAAAKQEDVPIYLSGIGTVQAFNTVSVKSRVDGEITQILFTEGQDVKAGDPLAVVDPRPLQAQLAQQQAMRAKDEANLTGAILDLHRYEDLVLKNFASRQQVDEQRATVDQARAQVQNDIAQIEYAQTQLSYTTIRAPLGGRVGIRQVDQGNFVHGSDNTVIVVITQLQPISVVFSLPANAVAASHLTLGETHIPVLAYAPDDTTMLDRGTVALVDNTVDPTTGTIKLKASFPNAELHLWPGNFVNGRLVVETRHAAVTIPAPALRHGPRGDFVWLARPDGTTISKGVTAGQTIDGRVLIERGLDRGAEVVTEGHFRLEDNARIEVVRDESTPRAASPPPRPPAAPKPPG